MRWVTTHEKSFEVVSVDRDLHQGVKKTGVSGTAGSSVPGPEKTSGDLRI